MEQDEHDFMLPHCQLYWDAFVLLNRQRIFNDNGPQPLPLSEILVAMDIVFDRRGDRIRSRDLYFDLILAMDSTYIEVTAEVIKKRRDKEARRANKGRGRGR